MFQSFWNVAAAFCVHEEPVQLQQTYHFGHHQNNLCTFDSRSDHSEKKSEQLKTFNNDLNMGEDHQDHLPSMTHLYVQNEKVDIVHLGIETFVTPEFYWLNGYQAPDLFQHSPPPLFSPLAVG